MFSVHQLPPGLIHITHRINPKCWRFAVKCPKNVVWGSITICIKASYWHYNTAIFPSSILFLTHLWISGRLLRESFIWWWWVVFSCCNFCELVKNLPVCGWPHKKSLSFHVHVCFCICQDHDVKWWSVSGVKRNSWRFNSITLDKLLNDMIPIFSSPSEIRQISSPLLKLFLHEIITDAIQFISLQLPVKYYWQP